MTRLKLLAAWVFDWFIYPVAQMFGRDKTGPEPPADGAERNGE